MKDEQENGNLFPFKFRNDRLSQTDSHSSQIQLTAETKSTKALWYYHAVLAIWSVQIFTKASERFNAHTYIQYISMIAS